MSTRLRTIEGWCCLGGWSRAPIGVLVVLVLAALSLLWADAAKCAAADSPPAQPTDAHKSNQLGQTAPEGGQQQAVKAASETPAGSDAGEKDKSASGRSADGSQTSKPQAQAEDLEQLEQKAFRAAVERVAPAVVRIETVGGLERVHRVLFGTGPTTGVIVDPQGYVISSAFNFVNKPASILVRLPDGTRKPAEVVCTDHNRMLTLLKVDVDQSLPVPEAAPENQLRVGQWAIAVGRTFEADRPNMSVGIVSALDRIWGKAIQTDALVSPNNYGGALVDIHGRVMGILVPLSPQRADEIAGVELYDSGIGFAIPFEHVRNILPRMKKGEDLHPGVIGISLSGNVHLGEAVIGACQPGSPAAEAGLRSGDKIVEIDGKPVSRAADVKSEISRRYAGDKIRMAVMRGTQRIEREMTLVAKLEPFPHGFLGILPMRDTRGSAGVVVRYVYPDSPAAKAGLQPGDVLLSLGGVQVRETAMLREQVGSTKAGTEVEIEFRRGDKPQKAKLKLAALPSGLPPEKLPPSHGDVPAETERPQVGQVSLRVPEFENEVFMYVPEGYHSDVPHGLVLWFHAAGGFEQKELLARWKPLCDQYDLILVAPKAANPTQWVPNELNLVEKLIEQIKSSYNVDGARIVAHGQDAGGTMAFMVGYRYRELVRGIAVVDGLPVGRAPDNDPLHRLAVYATIAKKSARTKEIQQSIKVLQDMRIPVTVKDLGDEPRYLNPEELAELARWIDMLDRI